MDRKPTKERRASAPPGAKQAPVAHDASSTPLIANGSARFKWVKTAVWTSRMLDALERGVKGGKWFSLWDKVWRPETLEASWRGVRRNKGAPGCDGVTVEAFERDLAGNLRRMATALRGGGYAPAPVKRVQIPKGPGSKQTRPLGIPAVRDRVVQGALLSVMEPVFETGFAEHSYGFRPGRSAKDALRRVQQLLDSGHTWVVDADIKGFFDTIPHGRLLALVEEKVSDGRVLALLRAFLEASALESGVLATPEEGTPQGAIISPLLANIYLDPLDHAMAGAGRQMTRYADDFVIMCRTREEAQEVLDAVTAWTREAGLALHPDKTRIADALEKGGGFDFLGYHFERGKRWPRKKSLDKLKESVRLKTRRNNGQAMSKIVKELNSTLRGWFEYFKHSCRPVFSHVDSFIRRRLRAILLKRRKTPRHGDGIANYLWPNAYFDKRGLFCLARARMLAAQSARQ